MIQKPPATDDAQTSQGPALPSDYNRVATVIMGLGRVLLTLGSPAHRIEAALELLAARLGVSAQFFSTPTALTATLGDEQRQLTYLVRADPGAPDFGKLSGITGVMDRLAEGQLETRQAYEQAEAIFHAPPRYGRWLSWLAFVLVSASAAVFLGGGLAEIILAAGLGGLTGLISILSPHSTILSRLHIPVTATLASFVAYLVSIYWLPADLMLPLVAGMITLLPGLDFTSATRELATGHLVSGSARMAGAIVIFMMLVFGLALGSYFGQLLAGPLPGHVIEAIPPWTRLAVLPIAAIGFSILFRAEARHWFWILISCVVALGGLLAGQQLLGPILGASLGGTLVGLAGNLYARISRLPGSIMHLPGLLLLVPGSIGFRSIAAVFGQDVVSGVERFVSALMTAVALATEMILASVLIPPKNEL